MHTLPPLVWPRKVSLLGVHVSVTDYEEATSLILEAARRRIPGTVACQAVHALVTASGDATMRTVVNAFDLVTPDGQPIRWAMNLLHRTSLRQRVYGPTLTLRLCRRAAEEGVPVYLYGSLPEVVARLRANLTAWFPGLQVAGAESPPFRPLAPEEDEETVRRINSSGAGILLLGLGCPKQDLFAYEHRLRIRPVQVCVGAAFDFHAGSKRMAPPWMQCCGLEWLFRLLQEPRRLWRRYLVTNSVFIAKLATELIRRVFGKEDQESSRG